MNIHVFGPILDKSLLHWLNSDSLSPVKNIFMNFLKKKLRKYEQKKLMDKNFIMTFGNF